MTAEPRTSNPFAVGLLMLAGLGCLAWLALRLGDWESPFARHYELTARFASASGLREGAFVEIAGVRVGSVTAIALDAARYESVVTMRLVPGFELPADAIASIRTAGLIGEKFVRITPGGAAETLASGDEILDTESSINIEELISKYIFESGDP
jgi:phospholipid/cholesterol/gamma-HCH transport system substrate-binding protein